MFFKRFFKVFNFQKCIFGDSVYFCVKTFRDSAYFSVKTFGDLEIKLYNCTENQHITYNYGRSETSNHNYEIDFLLSKNGKLCPIEVYTKDLRKDKAVTLLPVYLTMFL